MIQVTGGDDVRQLVCQPCWREIFGTHQFQCLCSCRCSSDSACPNGMLATTTVGNVRESVGICDWCHFLNELMSRTPDSYRFKNREIQYPDLLHIHLCHFNAGYSTPSGKNSYHVKIRVQTTNDVEPSGWSLGLHAFTGAYDPAAPFISARELQETVFSDNATQQIYDWLAACESHETCPRQTLEELPTRVIEVWPESDSGRPRLFIPGMVRGIYTALSYCWGKNTYAGLTRSNMSTYQTELDLETVPQAIRDAISVTKALGIPYLWVDSLCILQDSVNDKTTEISAMDKVYRGAIITLVAASSKSAAQGFLHPRPRYTKFYTLPFSTPSGEFGTFSIGDIRDREYDESLEPINTRAWCLQEGLLGHRYLVYSSHTLQWRCHAGVSNLGHSLHLVSSADEVQLGQSLYALSKGSSDPKTELKRWIRLVPLYTARLLSLPQDRLNAISAVAMTFASTLGPEYHAGLWQSSMLLELTWVPARAWGSPTAKFKRPEVYRAPSWSWASIEGGISYDDDLLFDGTDLRNLKCSFISCETKLRSEGSPFGEVLSSSLTLKGLLRQAWLMPGNNGELWPADDTTVSVKGEALPYEPMPEGGAISTRAWGFHDEAGQSDSMLVSCLPILSRGNGTATGLLLVPAEGTTFRRIGFFQGITERDFGECELGEVVII